MMSQNLVVAVWGNKGAGKGTFSAALAESITKYFSSVLLINADVWQPIFATWGVVFDPDTAVKQNLFVESIGQTLTYPNISEEYLHHRILYHPNHKSIGLMGYQANSDVEAFDPITGNAALSLLHEVKKMFQVTIVDCTTPKTDEVTDKALKYADVIIVLLEPNCLGVGFLKAQRSYIRNYFSDDRSYIFLAAKVEKISALDDFEKRLGVMFDNNLPYTQQARYKLHTHELFEKYGGDYGKSVDSIANRLKEEASS